MKKLIYTFLILAIGVQLSSAQCHNAVSERRVLEVENSIKRTQAGKDKMNIAMRFVKNNCLKSFQLTNLCLLFSKENKRYRLARASYKNIVDKQNFYDVYDLFTRFSTAMRLHDEVLGLKANNIGSSEPYAPTYSNLHFPDYHTYHGPTPEHCRAPVADRDFRIMLGQITFTDDDHTNLTILKNVTQRNCLATAQVMKLCAYLQVEKNRLNYLKFAADKTFDLGNYFETKQLLSHSANIDELTHYIHQHIDPMLAPPVVEEVCFVTENEFRTFKQDIKDQTFSSDMMRSAKYYVKTRCFNMNQIGSLSKVFSSDSDKLAYFKYAYDYAPEPENYLMFKSYLTFTSSKNKLSNFIISKERGQ